MIAPRFLLPLIATASLLAPGCSSSSGSPSQPGGGTCAAPSVDAVTVTPATANVMTCTSKTFTAAQSGSCPDTITWSVTGGGAVDANGKYSAPIQVPTPAQAAISASAGGKNGQSAVTLSTALPQPAVTSLAAGDDWHYQHQIAASGQRVYAAAVTIDKSASPYKYSLVVSASTDGGKTFGTPVKATDVPNPEVNLFAPSIAIDAGDPDAVYVAYTIDAGQIGKTSDAATPGSGQTMALAVSYDGGKTFQNAVLGSQVSSWEEYGDVTSPAPGVVVVVAPTGLADNYFNTYVDTTKGKAFLGGQTGLHPQIVSLNNARFDMLRFDTPLESPHLVGDGKSRTCLSYIGGYYGSVGDGKSRVIAQCSTDMGATFAAPVDLDYEAPGHEIHHPTSAFSKSGALAVAWSSAVEGGDRGDIHVAVSKDGGATFPKPVTVPGYQIPASVGLPPLPQYPALIWEGDILWLAYTVSDGGDAHRLIVDKSCDGGTTWSGPQLLNGPEPTIDLDYQPPGLALTDTSAFVFARLGKENHDLPLQVIRLAP